MHIKHLKLLIIRSVIIQREKRIIYLANKIKNYFYFIQGLVWMLELLILNFPRLEDITRRSNIKAIGSNVFVNVVIPFEWIIKYTFQIIKGIQAL